MEKEQLKDFLKYTTLTDANARLIQVKARLVTENCPDDQTRALKIFYFVRDNIEFGGSDLFARASDTLRVGIGDCGIKSNVQMSLLRAVGIPARLHAALIRSESLKGLVPESISKRLPQLINHLWCECYLSDRWIACETTYDKKLFTALKGLQEVPTREIPMIDWDGETDLTLFDPWTEKDLGIYSSYDAFIAFCGQSESEAKMPPKLYWKLLGWASNIPMNKHLNKIRMSVG